MEYSSDNIHGIYYYILPVIYLIILMLFDNLIYKIDFDKKEAKKKQDFELSEEHRSEKAISSAKERIQQYTNQLDETDKITL